MHGVMFWTGVIFWSAVGILVVIAIGLSFSAWLEDIREDKKPNLTVKKGTVVEREIDEAFADRGGSPISPQESRKREKGNQS